MLNRVVSIFLRFFSGIRLKVRPSRRHGVKPESTFRRFEKDCGFDASVRIASTLFGDAARLFDERTRM